MVVRQQQFLAMQDRGVERIHVRSMGDLARRNIDAPAFPEHRKRILDNTRIVQQRDLRFRWVEADDVEILASPDASECLRPRERLFAPSMRLGQASDVDVKTLGDALAYHRSGFSPAR